MWGAQEKSEGAHQKNSAGASRRHCAPPLENCFRRHCHQHMIWRQCLEVSTCWMDGCLATSWRTGSKLIWIEIFPESVNTKRICALKRQTPKRKANCNCANATRFFCSWPGGGRRRRLGPPLKVSFLARPDWQNPSKKWGNRDLIPGTSSSRVLCCGRRKSGLPAEPAGNVRTARWTLIIISGND